MVNLTTISGETPLMIAVRCSSTQVLNWLLFCGGINLHCLSKKKKTAYELAVDEKDE